MTLYRRIHNKLVWHDGDPEPAEPAGTEPRVEHDEWLPGRLMTLFVEVVLSICLATIMFAAFLQFLGR